VAGSFDYNPYPQQLALDATPIGVFVYDRGADDGQGYTLLPNIRCDQIQYKEGIEPPAARFSYILDETAAIVNGWPSQFDQVWPLTVTPSPYVVNHDDELVVLATLADNTTRVLFHGFARVPQTDLSPVSQQVTFVAVGVAILCWNTPIGGRIERNADNPQNGNNVQTDLPVRFNPAGTGTRAIGGYLPNCTPDGYDVGEGSTNPYPVFLDHNIDRSPDPRSFWGLSKAVRYILANWNTQTLGSLVDNPDFGVLDALLQNRRPLVGAEFFDPSNSSTYQTDPNRIRDFDATNKPWPEVVAELLSFYGFGMRWVCSTNGGGQPDDYIEFYRKDAAGPTAPKPIYLPETGSQLSTALANVATMHAAFDYQAVANSFYVETAPERYEVSVILAPGYQPQAGDGTAANRVQFRKSALDTTNATAATRARYRFYIADECGDGHWSQAQSQWLTTPINFSSIFQLPDGNPDNLPAYVRRYRAGRNTLFSKDLNNKPLQAQLALSRNYVGADAPCIWDTVSGTWQQIDGGWSLMEDRLGIEVTVDDPEAWNIGKPPAGAAAQEPTGVLHGISSIANPSSTIQSENMFWLRLTTVIEADYGIEAIATRRDASPLSSTIMRRVDARDHFHYDVIDGSSAFNQAPGTDHVVQDDSDAAVAHACQLRSAHEFPPLAAAVTIPMLVDYVQIGDRIAQINGRNVSFLVNSGIEQGEAPSYPFVVGLTWDFQASKQSTTVQLADRRLEPSHV
jgi:hypothetical protein